MSADVYIVGADYGTSSTVVARLVQSDGLVIRLITADEFYLDNFDTSPDSTAVERDFGALLETTDRVLATSIINVVRELKLSLKERAERAPWIEHEVRAWHRRRACQAHAKCHTAALPRGRVRRWRSLKEKRQAWGLA